MRKAIGLAFAALLLAATPVLALDYTQLEGNLAVVDSSSTSVTLLVTQTAGEPATLHIGVSCAAGEQVFRFKEYRVVSGDTLTVSAGHKSGGETIYADRCGISLYYKISGHARWSLDGFTHHF